MGETWIAVTGFYATDNPHPGLAVARCLRQADPSWRVLALTWDGFGTGSFADDVIDAHALVPYPSLGAPPLAAALKRLRARHPIDVVVPTVDAEQAHWIAIRPALRRLGIRTLLPTLAALRAREKRRLPLLARRSGVEVPPTTAVPSLDAAARIAMRLSFPQILKGPYVDTVVVHAADDFVVAAQELGRQWGFPLLAQPLLSGEEYDVAAVARGGALLGAAVMKKLAVTGKGTAWAGVTVDEPRFVAALARQARALGWEGAVEGEYLLTPDGEIACLEINPRFPSWIALAAEAGANLPATLVRAALGEAAEAVTAGGGRLFARALVERVYAADPLAALKPGRVVRGLLTPVAGARSPEPGVITDGVVAVTGLNAADNPSPGLTVTRALRAAPTAPRVIGLTHEILSTGAYVDAVFDEIRLLPFPSREDGYPEALIGQCREAGVDCLISTLDIEMPVVSWLAPRLRAAGIETLVPSLEAQQAVAKRQLPALAERGFRLPRTEMLWSFDDLPRLARALGMPFVLKGPVADARIVADEREARTIARRLCATWGLPLIAQEFIAGEELAIAAVADRRHRVVGAISVRKTIRSANGNTWGGVVVDDAKLRALGERFAETLDWVGPFELEVIRHPGRGLFLIEVNARFPAWIYLSAGAGANLPWIAVRLARGQRVSPVSARAGSFYVRMAWDFTAPVERMGSLAVEGKVSGHVA